VGAGLILETTFLIDLERELRARAAGPAQTFLAANTNEPLFITFTVAGELASGRAPADRPLWEKSIEPFEVLESNADTCWEFGRLHRFLRTNGLLIGTTDLWIAATALAYNKSLVTRNVREFQRVPGLTVRGYA
jgi:predicted nucleic acid-binding protein